MDRNTPHHLRHPIVLALGAGLLWLVALAGIWAFLEARGETWPLGIFLGRFHILIVHLPIGLLLAALGMEILARIRLFPGLNDHILPLLWLGFLGAIGATLAGYTLMESDGYEGKFMERHMWTGLGVVALALLTLVFHLKGPAFQPLYLASLFLTVGLVSVSSHFGGNMVHGETYLTDYAPAPLKPLLGHPGEPEPEPVAELSLEDFHIFDDIIQPVFDAKCVECHNENKVKGKLRMDSFEQLAKGGDLGEEFVPGDAEASELYYRVTLPPDDLDFMPPDDKEPLTQDEVTLLAWWINQGASPDMKVGEAQRDPVVAQILEAWFEQKKATLTAESNVPTTAALPAWEDLSPQARSEALAALEAAARDLRLVVAPLSGADDRLVIDVVNCADDFGDEQMRLLEPVAGHIASLDLGSSRVTDEALRVVSRMTRLERLHLEKTAVTDAGLTHLAELSALEYLNLFGTAVTDDGLAHLRDLHRLNKLFVWQTEVTPEGARQFQRLMSLEVNTGKEESLAMLPASANDPGAPPAAGAPETAQGNP